MTREEAKKVLITIRKQGYLDDAGYGYETEEHKDALCALDMAIKALEQKSSSGDMVSRGVFEQVMWERDVAIKQLKELGYELGEKPKTGHWITHKQYGIEQIECSECSKCFLSSHLLRNSCYCPNCGCRMVEPQESEDKE